MRKILLIGLVMMMFIIMGCSKDSNSNVDVNNNATESNNANIDVNNNVSEGNNSNVDINNVAEDNNSNVNDDVTENNNLNVDVNNDAAEDDDAAESEVRKSTHEIIYENVDKLFGDLQIIANQNGFELSTKETFYQRIDGIKVKFSFVSFGSLPQNFIESWINEDDTVNNVNIIVKKESGDLPKAEVMVNAVLNEIGLSSEEHNKMWNDFKKFENGYTSGLIKETFYGYCTKLDKKVSMRVSISDNGYQFFIRVAKK